MDFSYTEKEVIDLVENASGRTLRREYQPTVITKLINNYFGESGAMKTLCGCGGGKTIMMNAAIVLAVLKGAKKVAITAPTIALCRQLEYSLIDLFNDFAKKGHTVPADILFYNASSDGQKKAKDLDDEEYAAEHEGLDEEDIAGTKNSSSSQEADKVCKSFGAKRSGGLDHKKIKDAINRDKPTIFFVCKPSFLKTFQAMVSEVAVDFVGEKRHIIDITCHDEFHNFISQERSDRTKNVLQKYANLSKNNWFFSASKKRGERFSWDHPIFGNLTDDVPTYRLVEMGYLVPNLKIYLVTAGMISGIQDSIRELFESRGIPKAEKFYQEAAVIISILQHQISLRSTPKIIHFTAKVSYIRMMMEIEEFQVKLKEVIELLECYEMDGSTPRDERSDTFESLAAATAEIATILLQHSTCKEGIDCPNFNVASICRGMSEISLQQALGRIQRTHEGKDTAYLYLYVNGDEGQLATLADFLHYNFGKYNYSIHPAMDDHVGIPPDEDQSFINMNGIKIPLINGKADISEWVRQKVNQIEEESRKRMEDDADAAKSDEQVLTEFEAWVNTMRNTEGA